MTTIGELRKALAEATTEKNLAANRQTSIARQLALAVAADKGISIGTIMVHTRKEGWRPKERIVTRRARVTEIIPSQDLTEFKLWGTTIRKDGSDGENHELYSYDNWKVEGK